ncbi:ATP-binding protein [Streptosporangium canum]|uniref:ATP-binding protein n=1 Tax=Streptosporangium canum TaxID=324952 RepID=UPI0036B1F361
MNEPARLSNMVDRCLANVRATRNGDGRPPIGVPRNWDLDLTEELIERAVELTDSRVPTRYQAATVSEQLVNAWVNKLVSATTAPGSQLGCGPSLLLLGDVGRGKTYQGFAAIRALASFGISIRWAAMTEGDLFARLRPRHGIDSESEFQAIAGAPMLLLDDLGSAKTSEWTEEITYRVVNHRYEHLLPTIFTSNVLPANLKNVLGDRVTSRLAQMAMRVVLTGPDRRREVRAA